MADPNFTLTANLYLPSEHSPSLDVSEVRDLFARVIPNARVDLSRGRDHVQQRIDRLKSMGAPEVIYRNEFQNLDRTICVDIPIPQSNSRLVGYTTGFSYYDGCISFACEPFDVHALMLGAKSVADALHLDLTLSTPDQFEVALLVVYGRATEAEMVSHRFDDLLTVSGSFSFDLQTGTSLATACDSWLSTHPEERTKTMWLDAVPDSHSLFDCLSRRLASLGTLHGAAGIRLESPSWHHCIVLWYDGWTALLNFSGHPGPILRDG